MTDSAVQQSIAAAAAAAAASLDAAHGGGADDERLSDDAVGRPPGICHANRPRPPPHVPPCHRSTGSAK